jgi:hypothetical protein
LPADATDYADFSLSVDTFHAFSPISLMSFHFQRFAACHAFFFRHFRLRQVFIFRQPDTPRCLIFAFAVCFHAFSFTAAAIPSCLAAADGCSIFHQVFRFFVIIAFSDTLSLIAAAVFATDTVYAAFIIIVIDFRDAVFHYDTKRLFFIIFHHCACRCAAPPRDAPQRARRRAPRVAPLRHAVFRFSYHDTRPRC